VKGAVAKTDERRSIYELQTSEKAEAGRVQKVLWSEAIDVRANDEGAERQQVNQEKTGKGREVKSRSSIVDDVGVLERISDVFSYRSKLGSERRVNSLQNYSENRNELGEVERVYVTRKEETERGRERDRSGSGGCGRK
jgi:hypothetical protein